jgi:hypothetical protein
MEDPKEKKICDQNFFQSQESYSLYIGIIGCTLP